MVQVHLVLGYLRLNPLLIDVGDRVAQLASVSEVFGCFLASESLVVAACHVAIGGAWRWHRRLSVLSCLKRLSITVDGKDANFRVSRRVDPAFDTQSLRLHLWKQMLLSTAHTPRDLLMDCLVVLLCISLGTSRSLEKNA